jgi:trans-2-enoyl-CoA reductase
MPDRNCKITRSQGCRYVRRSELIPEIEKLGVDFVGVESPEPSKQIRIAGGTPISLGLDAVGGPATATMASVLSPGAHLVSYAQLSGSPIHVLQGDLIGKRLNIHGFWMYYEEYLPKMRPALTEATKGVASGKLTLPITTTNKPSQIKEATEHSQRGGKVLLDFNHPNYDLRQIRKWQWISCERGCARGTKIRSTRIC